jgi:excisionase family DNA binding protein
MMPVHITAAAAASRLGLSVQRVRDLCRDGRPPAQKIGRDWIINTADLKAVAERKAGRPRKEG